MKNIINIEIYYYKKIKVLFNYNSKLIPINKINYRLMKYPKLIFRKFYQKIKNKLLIFKIILNN